MNRTRLAFFVLVATASVGLAACSIIVNGKLEERAASCDGRSDGTPCLGADYCVNGACVFAGCGDRVVTAGEQCDDGNTNSFDGCTNFCTYSCNVSADCEDGQICNGTETCTAQHACVRTQPEPSGTACTLDGGGSGSCDGAGLCVSAGCGNGTVEAGEDCEPPSSPGCRADCRFVCTSDFDCPTDNVCTDNRRCDTATHVCVQAPPPSCDDGDPCSADACPASVGSCTNPVIDGDRDGYAPLPAPVGACSANPAYRGGDCDDSRDDTYPGAIDLCNDGIDQDCNGTADDGGALTCYRDYDGDSFGDPNDVMSASCQCPSGYVPGVQGLDCDDLNDNVRPNFPGEAPRWTAIPECSGKSDVVEYGDGVFGCSDGGTLTWDVDCDQSVDIESKEAAGMCRANLLSGDCQGAGFTNGVVPDCGGTADYTGCERNCGLIACPCAQFSTRVTQRCH